MKKFVALLLSVVMLSAIVPSAFAATYPFRYRINDCNISYTASTTSVTANVTSYTTFRTDDLLVAAAFDEDKVLLDYATLDFALYPWEQGNFNLEIPVGGDKVNFVKVCVLDNIENVKPLADVWSSEWKPSGEYAIVLRVTSNDEVVLLHSDGTSATYNVTSHVDLGEIEDAIDCADGDVTERIVSYSVKKSTNEISSIRFVDCIEFDGEYKARTGKIVTLAIKDYTHVIDATLIETARDARSASNYSAFAHDSFADGRIYTGVAVKEGTHTVFMVITAYEVLIDQSSRFAVVKDATYPFYSPDDDECELIRVLDNGQDHQKLLAVPGFCDWCDLDTGDAFFYQTDRYGFVDEVYKIFDRSSGDFTSLNYLAPDMLPTGAEGWSYNVYDEGYDLQLAMAIVTDVDSDTIALANWDCDMTSLDTNIDLDDDHYDGVVFYPIASNCQCYWYNPDSNEVKEGNKYSTKSAKLIEPSDFAQFDPDRDGVYEGDNMFDYATEALVMIADGEVVQIYVIEK